MAHHTCFCPSKAFPETPASLLPLQDLRPMPALCLPRCKQCKPGAICGTLPRSLEDVLLASSLPLCSTRQPASPPAFLIVVDSEPRQPGLAGSWRMQEAGRGNRFLRMFGGTWGKRRSAKVPCCLARSDGVRPGCSGMCL